MLSFLPFGSKDLWIWPKVSLRFLKLKKVPGGLVCTAFSHIVQYVLEQGISYHRPLFEYVIAQFSQLPALPSFEAQFV